MPRSIGIGLIGFGWMGHAHARSYRSLPVYFPEAGLVGGAICVGVGVGLFSSAQEGARTMVRIEERYEPNPALSAKYDEMFDIYRSAYQALVGAGVFERIAEL